MKQIHALLFLSIMPIMLLCGCAGAKGTAKRTAEIAAEGGGEDSGGGVRARPARAAYRDTTDYDSLITVYSEMVQSNPESSEAYYLRGKAYFGAENYSGAFEDFERAVSLDSHYADVYYMRGKTYFYVGEAEKAMADYGRAIELNPDHGLAHAWRGLAYLLVPYPEFDTELADSDIKRARRLGADENDAYFLSDEEDGDDGDDDQNKSRADDGDKLLLVAIMTDSVLTLGARGGFMPSLFYREFHRYATKDGLDTLLEHTPGKKHVHPKTGDTLTVWDRREIFLYLVDSETRDIVNAMYTRSGEMVTAVNSFGQHARVESVNAGDTVFALANPRRRIIVSAPSEFVSKPLSVYDECKNRLMMVKERFNDAEDADDIIIATEDEVIEIKVARLVKAIREVGYPNISRAKLRE